MGVIQRILRRTSDKLLSKLGAPRSSYRLPNGRHQAPLGGHQVVYVSGQLAGLKKSSKRARRNKSCSNRKPMKEKDSSMSEALLASKNYLPPVQFHHVHGPYAQLSNNKFVARRTQSFCQALVFSNRVILPNERVYIKVLDIAKGWSGTIRFGFTSLDPATLRYQMPKHACPDMTNAGHTWARALADEVVRRNSVIHFSYNSAGFIHYGINNQDCGVFHANVDTSQHLWFIVDIYGLTAAVELIDPRIHNASSELDFSRIDDELRTGGTNSTMFKSTVSMNESAPGLMHQSTPILAGAPKKGRKSRKSARLPALEVHQQWLSEGGAHLGRPMAGYDVSNNAGSGPLLPNLNSILLPPAQQNIYSPMPGLASAVAPRTAIPPQVTLMNDSHDYYQIMTNLRPAKVAETGTNRKAKHREAKEANSAAPALAEQQPPMATDQSNLSSNYSYASPSAGASAGAVNLSGLVISPPVARAAARNIQMAAANRVANQSERDLCQQMESLKFEYRNRQQSVALVKPMSSNNSNLLNRRRQQQQQSSSVQQGSKWAQEATTNSRDPAQCSPSEASPSQQSTLKSKPKSSRQATASSQKVPFHDSSNNQNPASKDCPICFERPINCVLYQCGHMCTCYECGVKQWRTQSRTCPICRTVIKDVIKTYLS